MLKKTITHLKGILIFPMSNQSIIVDFFHKLIDEKSEEYHNSKIHMSIGNKLTTKLIDKVKKENKQIKQTDVSEKVRQQPEFITWETRGKKILEGFYDVEYKEKYGECALMKQIFIHSFNDEDLAKIKHSQTVEAIFGIMGVVVSKVVKDDFIVLTFDLEEKHIPYRQDVTIWEELSVHIHGGGILWNCDGRKVFYSRFTEGKVLETEWWSTSLTDKLFNKMSEFLGEINEYLNLFNPTEVSTQFDNMIVVGN